MKCLIIFFQRVPQQNKIFRQQICKNALENEKLPIFLFQVLEC